MTCVLPPEDGQGMHVGSCRSRIAIRCVDSYGRSFRHNEPVQVEVLPYPGTHTPALIEERCQVWDSEPIGCRLVSHALDKLPQAGPEIQAYSSRLTLRLDAPPMARRGVATHKVRRRGRLRNVPLAPKVMTNRFLNKPFVREVASKPKALHHTVQFGMEWP